MGCFSSKPPNRYKQNQNQQNAAQKPVFNDPQQQAQYEQELMQKQAKAYNNNMGYNMPVQRQYCPPGVPNYNTTQNPQYMQAYGGYANYNVTNHQLQTYPFQPNSIDQYAESLFVQFDTDRSGDINMIEFPMLLQAFYNSQNLQAPRPEDTMY